MTRLFLMTLFYLLLFGFLLVVASLPLPYSLFIWGLIILLCLYWIVSIIRDPKLTRQEKWDKLTCDTPKI